MGWSWEDLIDYWPEVLEKSCNLSKGQRYSLGCVL